MANKKRKKNFAIFFFCLGMAVLLGGLICRMIPICKIIPGNFSALPEFIAVACLFFWELLTTNWKNVTP